MDRYSRDSTLLRMPWAKANPGPQSRNLGVIIEKTGEDNDLSKKQRVMFLYSKTIHRESGRLVCSRDWRDYQLGQWIWFSTNDVELYFGSGPIDPPFPTRISQISGTVVQVYVRFFIVPEFISHRRCCQGWKVWSPEIGICYIDFNAERSLGIRDGRMYAGWVEWATTHVNFDSTDCEPSGWPYEPNAYWHVFFDQYQQTVTLLDNMPEYLQEVAILREMAERQTLVEKEIKEEHRVLADLEIEEAARKSREKKESEAAARAFALAGQQQQTFAVPAPPARAPSNFVDRHAYGDHLEGRFQDEEDWSVSKGKNLREFGQQNGLVNSMANCQLGDQRSRNEFKNNNNYDNNGYDQTNRRFEEESPGAQMTPFSRQVQPAAHSVDREFPQAPRRSSSPPVQEQQQPAVFGVRAAGTFRDFVKQQQQVSRPQDPPSRSFAKVEQNQSVSLSSLRSSFGLRKVTDPAPVAAVNNHQTSNHGILNHVQENHVPVHSTAAAAHRSFPSTPAQLQAQTPYRFHQERATTEQTLPRATAPSPPSSFPQTQPQPKAFSFGTRSASFGFHEKLGQTQQEQDVRRAQPPRNCFGKENGFSGTDFARRSKK